jgi:2,4-dienoyl-CoA reductase-like NADH-dependent reductase (Old Yellow Enzyme family)
MNKLFQQYDLAGLPLANRVVMAPMTRSRNPDMIPNAQTALYYAQRASAGLIISEGIPISQEGTGFLFNPSLYNDTQAAGWAEVTEAVHARGGRIFAQLWHVGRLSHVSIQESGAAPVGPVNRPAETSSAFAWTESGVAGMVPASTPRAIPAAEIPRVINDFVLAARRAIAAGFDGIELHGANGYLFEQFINGELNVRDDAYGGTIENRLRLLLETVDALIAEVGAHRLGVRISPYGRLYDMKPFADERETWIAVAEALDQRQIAYVHTSDQLVMGFEAIPAHFAAEFRQAYHGTLISAGGFERESAERALQNESLNLIAFGRPFIANPDLVERMENGWPLAEADRVTFYGQHGATGYTDYPNHISGQPT